MPGLFAKGGGSTFTGLDLSGFTPVNAYAASILNRLTAAQAPDPIVMTMPLPPSYPATPPVLPPSQPSQPPYQPPPYQPPTQPPAPYTPLPTMTGAGPGTTTITGGYTAGGAPMFDPTADPALGNYFTGGSSPPTSSGSPCDLITNPIARYACQVAIAAGQKYLNKDPGGCPQGYHADPKTGGCVIDGVGSYLPGDVGRPDYVWTPVNGWYGAGLTPVLVQQAKRSCPAGYVLGKDGVCYDHLPRTKRAHNPGAKPFLTGGQMNSLRQAHAVQKTLGKLNRRFGAKKAKCASCGPSRKRK